MKVTLRDYQTDALERISAAERRGVRRQLGVAATGLGKTVMFCAEAERRQVRTLVLAHRDELISQAVAKVREVWPEANVGIVKAGENDVRADVVVASVQTLARPKRLAQLLAPFSDVGLLGRAEPFGLVVVDEAHHAAADSYRSILTGLRAGAPGCVCGELHERAATPDEVDDGCELGVAYDPCPMVPPGPLLLGVTATPDRGDGKGLDDLFDEIVFSYDLLWGIRAGYLSDLRGLRVRIDNLDLADVKVSRGDFEAGAAGRALEDAGAPPLIVRAWLADHELPDGTTITARDRKTLVFTPTVALAQACAAEFVGAGISAAFVSGETPLDDRRTILRRFAAGEILVLANCAVLTEGFDEPSVSCIVQARPTKSRALYTQMIGRGTRRHPAKDDCLVLDVVGSSDELSLVTIPSLFGIEQKVRPYRDGEPVTVVVDEHDRELVRLGKLSAEEANLFAAVRREGIAWVATHSAKDPLRRFERSLAIGQLGEALPTVVLAQRVEGEDVWTAGLWWRPTKTDPLGVKQVLMADVPLELAQGVAEDYVRKVGSPGLTTSDAKWRKRKPTPKQIAAAKKWHLTVDPKWTAGDLSDALDAHIARAKRRQGEKARSSQ